MNPFELTGLHFLLFYAIFGAILLGGMYWWRRASGTADDGSMPKLADDPYRIAYLRAGAKEAVAVATVSLIDRGLLLFDKGILATKDATSAALVQRRIERELLLQYATPGKFSRAPSLRVASVCNEYRKELLAYGLLPDFKEKLQGALVALTVIACLLATTVIKAHIALSQGRHNLGFLIALTAIFSFMALKMAGAHASVRGQVVLADLRNLFARLKARAKHIRAGGETNEAALLIAVFGLQTLPVETFPFIKTFYPPNNGGGDGGSSCSSGGSCGGGCGGGGCGG